MKFWQGLLIGAIGMVLGAALLLAGLSIEFSHAWSGMH